MTSKIDINLTDVPMDLNATVENQGETNKTEVPIYNYSTAAEKNHISPQVPDNHSSLFGNSRSSTSQSR